MNQYIKGRGVKLKATLTDPDTKAAVDPASVTITAVAPSGTKQTENYPGNVLKEGAGVFSLIVVPDEVGVWYASVKSSEGPVVEETMFQVNPDHT